MQRAKLTSDTVPAHLDFVFGPLPEAADELKPIDWATFFAMFHLMGLALAYEEDDFELLQMEGRKSGRFEGKPLMS